MNSYDDFILQVGNVSDFPQNIYGKVRFHIIAEKIKFPAAAVFLIFMFVGIISISMDTKNQTLDWDFGTEEIVFSQNNNYYALFDE